MKTKELREMTRDELSGRRRDLKAELLNMRVQQASGQLENPSRLKAGRKEIARIETILNERLLNIAIGKGTSKTKSAPKPTTFSAPASKESAPAPLTEKAAKKSAAKKAADKVSAENPEEEMPTATKKPSAKKSAKAKTKTAEA